MAGMLEQRIVNSLLSRGFDDEKVLKTCKTLNLDVAAVVESMGAYRTKHTVKSTPTLSHRDVSLSPLERLRVYLNKHLGVTGGSGAGYNCVNCRSENVHYFKREFVQEGEESNKVFYLMGGCNSCGNEQRVVDIPNDIIYWRFSRIPMSC